MTKPEWAEAVEWLAIRYPSDTWTNKDRINAYYLDLRRHPAEDIWTAIHMYHEQGNTRAPLSSQLIALARDAAHHRTQIAVALPETTDTISWKEYATRTYGRAISLNQAALLEYNKTVDTSDSPW